MSKQSVAQEFSLATVNTLQQSGLLDTCERIITVYARPGFYDGAVVLKISGEYRCISGYMNTPLSEIQALLPADVERELLDKISAPQRIEDVADAARRVA